MLFCFCYALGKLVVANDKNSIAALAAGASGWANGNTVSDTTGNAAEERRVIRHYSLFRLKKSEGEAADDSISVTLALPRYNLA